MQLTSLFVLASLAASSLCVAVADVKRQTSEEVIRKIQLQNEGTYLGLAPWNAENDYRIVFINQSQANGPAEQWLFSGGNPSFSLQNIEYGVYLYVNETSLDTAGNFAPVLFTPHPSNFRWTVETTNSVSS
ncbi:hypothetical protein C0991_007665, partial [Blastosporella zonata]